MITSLDRLRAIHNKYAVRLGGGSERVLMKGDEATILLYRAIVPADEAESWGGISAEMFAADLEKAKNAKRIHLRVNSIGGVVFEAKAMLTLFRAHQAEKIVHVDGLAASAATIVAMGGDKIITAPEATWFIHPAQALGYGNATDFRSLAETLDRETRTIVDLYAKRTKSSIEDLKKWIDPECEMTAQDALERGFTDEIEGEPAGEEKGKIAASGEGLVKIAAETQRRINQERFTRLREWASPPAPPASRDPKSIAA